MSAAYEKPVTRPDPGPGGSDRTITTHPAFGQIRAARVSGNTFLYGSDFRHHNHVVVTISKSEEQRDLSKDWRHERAEVVEVAMSEAQWATFISTLNVGWGTPCTLTRIGGEHVPQIAQARNAHDEFNKELVATLAEAEQHLSALERQINDSPLSGSKKKELLNTLTLARNDLSKNTGFVATQFGHHMEKTKSAAKSELEAFFLHAVQRAGAPALGGAAAPLALSEEHPPKAE